MCTYTIHKTHIDSILKCHGKPPGIDKQKNYQLPYIRGRFHRNLLKKDGYVCKDVRNVSKTKVLKQTNANWLWYHFLKFWWLFAVRKKTQMIQASNGRPSFDLLWWWPKWTSKHSNIQYSKLHGFMFHLKIWVDIGCNNPPKYPPMLQVSARIAPPWLWRWCWWPRHFLPVAPLVRPLGRPPGLHFFGLHRCSVTIQKSAPFCIWSVSRTWSALRVTCGWKAGYGPMVNLCPEIWQLCQLWSRDKDSVYNNFESHE